MLRNFALTNSSLDAADLGAHSLRAGYVTEAHKRLETTQRYARGTVDAFKSSKVEQVFKAAHERRKNIGGGPT